MKFTSLSLSRVRARIRVRARARASRGLLYGIDVSEKDECYEKVTIKLPPFVF